MFDLPAGLLLVSTVWNEIKCRFAERGPRVRRAAQSRILLIFPGGRAAAAGEHQPAGSQKARAASSGFSVSFIVFRRSNPFSFPYFPFRPQTQPTNTTNLLN